MCGLLFAESEALKGKPWTVEEEKQLKEMVQAGKSLGVISEILGKSAQSVKQKLRRLGLKVVGRRITCPTSSNAADELPSVEKALRSLAAALKALETEGLDPAETLRLRSIIQGVKVYQELFADFMDYRGIEAKLIDLDEKYDRLVRDKGKNSKA